MIALPLGGEVRLDDLGVVTDTVAEPRTFARLDGEPIVAFGIWRSKGASDVVVAKASQKRVDEITKANPDVELKLIDTSVEYTLGNYERRCTRCSRARRSRSSWCSCSCATSARR